MNPRTQLRAHWPCSLAEDQCAQAGGQSDGQGRQTALLAAAAQTEAAAGVVLLVSGEYYAPVHVSECFGMLSTVLLHMVRIPITHFLDFGS